MKVKNVTTCFLVTCFLFILSCTKKNGSRISEKETDIKSNHQSLINFDKQKLLQLLHHPENARNVLDEDAFLEYLDENLDSLGAWHNEFQDYIFTRTVEAGLSLCEKETYKQYNGWMTEFFASKGIEFNDDFIEYYTLNNLEGQNVSPREELSVDANAILESLQNNIDTSDKMELAEFVERCEELKSLCLSSLSDNAEKIQVGSAISVAKYSAIYWDEHFEEWNSYYSAMPCSPINNDEGKLSPTETKVLQADSAGAIGAAIGSAPGGPLMMFCGALIGGGVNSCISAICIGFGIDHITDWLW